MTIDKKKLVVPSVVLASLVVAYFIADFTVLSKAQQLKGNILRVQGDVNGLKRFNLQSKGYEDRLKQYAQETFGLEEMEVSEQIRDRIDKMISTSRMRRGKEISSSISGKTKPNMYREIGWRYKLIGSLRQAVNMMYLLRNDPYLHRIEGLNVEPTKDRKEVKLSFQYIALVLIPKKNEKLPTSDSADPKAIPKLADSKQLPLYYGIAGRNLFRPYLPKSAPPPRVAKRTKSPSPAPAPSTDWGKYKVVDLSQWGPEKDIRIENTQKRAQQRFRLYNVGDSLAGGTIVMVDYRTMPKPSQPELLSYSRLILKIGGDYYAVELGRSLAEKHRLKGKDIPPSLRKSPTSAPESGTGFTKPKVKAG